MDYDRETINRCTSRTRQLRTRSHLNDLNANKSNSSIQSLLREKASTKRSTYLYLAESGANTAKPPSKHIEDEFRRKPKERK
jgi:hypothetical protein